MLLCFMKAEYHLKLIINCICLYVGRENGCSSSKMPKIGFSNLVTPPTLVAMVTRKMKYFEHFYFFINDTLHRWIFLKSNPFLLLFLVSTNIIKNEQKMQFQAGSKIPVAMETKMRRKTKLACVQLFKYVSMFDMLY